jgi:hypothetical protein
VATSVAPHPIAALLWLRAPPCTAVAPHPSPLPPLPASLWAQLHDGQQRCARRLLPVHGRAGAVSAVRRQPPARVPPADLLDIAAQATTGVPGRHEGARANVTVLNGRNPDQLPPPPPPPPPPPRGAHPPPGPPPRGGGGGRARCRTAGRCQRGPKRPRLKTRGLTDLTYLTRHGGRRGRRRHDGVDGGGGGGAGACDA